MNTKFAHRVCPIRLEEDKKMVRKSILLQAARLALTLALVMTLLAQPASAQFTEFVAVIDNFGKKPRNAHADVSCDSTVSGGPIDMRFDIFDQHGGHLAEFYPRTNANGFASSASFGNLFNLSGGQPILVRIRPPTASASCAATLHVDSQDAPLTTGLIPTVKTDGATPGKGRQFNIAMGSFQSASLMIANVGGSEATVDVSVLSPAGPGNGIYSKPRLVPNAIWRIDLSQNEANSNLVVTSTDWITLQVVINDGKSTQSFMAPSWR